jgi:hypothetical protein
VVAAAYPLPHAILVVPDTLRRWCAIVNRWRNTEQARYAFMTCGPCGLDLDRRTDPAGAPGGPTGPAGPVPKDCR